MAVKIGSLFFDMRVGLAAWQRDMGRASKRLQRFGSSVGRVARQMSIFGGAVSGVGLVLLANRTIEAADNIDKLSARLGVSTEALSQYRHVAELSGVQFNTLTMALQRMTRRVSEAASGTGEARDAIKELGLSAEALERLSPDQQFEVLADALQNVESQTDRVRLAFKLFDSEGVAVLQTMEDGAEGIRRMREEADKLGKTLTREQTDKLVAAKDAWTRFNAAIEGMVQTFVVELGPALAAVGEWLADRLPIALSWLKTRWVETWEGILLLVAKVATAMGRLFTALVPLTRGELQQKYRDWALSMYEVAEGALAMTSAVQGGLEVNVATMGRFDESLKEHASTWERVKLESAEAGEEMAKAAEVAEEKLDGTATAARGVETAVGRIGSQAISGQLDSWQTLGNIAVSVLQDIAREAIRTAARLLAMNVAMGFAGGGGGGLGPQYGGTDIRAQGSFARGGSLVMPPGGGRDSQLLVAKVSPNERVDFTPAGAARAAPLEITINNHTGQPVQMTRTPRGPQIDIGRQLGGVMGRELRDNPNGPLGKALQDYLGVPGATPIAR